MMFTLNRILFLLALVVLTGATVSAQEFRGSIAGRVTDNSGAAVNNATVNIVNLATNSAATTTTNESGSFTVLYLTPGRYRVSVEASGFKKSVRQDLEVRVGDKLELDLQLEVGAVSETVNITTDAPLLETSTGSAGQVIDRRRISELPLSDGNPFVLTRLAPGIAYTGDLLFSRPFDNGGTSSIVADGAPGGNEFTLDGTPNQASGRRVAFVPPADAVQEFKVETASFDGQQSHTAGATVNVTMRSGANQFHGTAYEFVRNDVLSANNFFNNLNAPLGRDSRGKAKRDITRYNRYGGTFGGPVVLPRFGQGGKPIWVGRDRSFFFFSYEGLRDAFQEPGSFTVPTLAMRQGDFSALLPSIVIYDPATARQNGARVERSPFPGNRIPSNRFSPIALNYLKFYPEPNVVTDPLGTNNFFSSNPRTDKFHSESFRFDQTLSDVQRFFVRYSQNNRREGRGPWAGEVNGIRPIGNFLFRINKSGTFDHIYNLGAATILNTRVGFSRFIERDVRQHQGAFNPASLGFSAATVAFFGNASYLPRFEIGGVSVLGQDMGGTTTFNIYSVQPTLTKIVGNHSFKMGYDFRAYRENGIPTAHAAGRYDFANTYTRQFDNTSGTIPGGQPFAAFLLGQPTGGIIARNTSRSNQTIYNAPFFHDDWKVSHKLTLNLGVRYELEGATTERFNRNITGFDATVASPAEAAARAAYAANPIPEVAASSFNLKGGLLFANDNARGFWDADKNNVQPRVGFAYQLNEKTVLRGGWGIFTVPAIIFAVQQPGFSQDTTIQPTANVGLTFQANLLNPFPFGVDTPPGASQGISTFRGRDITIFPRDLNNPQTQRWEFGMQREMPGNWLLEASYVGNRGYDLTTGNITNLLNSIPRQHLSTNLTRDATVVTFLSQNFPNPFRNLEPFRGTGFFNNNTQARSQLLRPFPEFGNITSVRTDGSSIYHSGQFKAEKRFSKGYSLLTAYTWSKYIERVSMLNVVDADFERRISRDDVPHRVVASGIFEVPFGKGRKWGGGWNSYVDGVLGGWQLNAIYQWQSGRPLDLGDRNVVYFGDPSQLRNAITSANADPKRKVFDISNFYFTDVAVRTNATNPATPATLNDPLDPAKQRADQRIALANNIRYFPTRLSGFRGQNLNLWDISVMKKVKVYERLQLELRGEFLNAFNHVQFNDPETNPTSANLGRVTSQANLPRNVQIGLKLIF